MPDRFLGSNSLYLVWNDMNEPSVFDVESKTLPLNSIHVTADGVSYEHRDVHNAYGGLQQKASFNGLMKRDNNQQRPFVLTRSFFVGSQRYGAYWTGDNVAEYGELKGALEMILQLGNAGHPFGGADVPGFFGEPTDELFIMFYQLGMYFPFFRAHSEIQYQKREPWL